MTTAIRIFLIFLLLPATILAQKPSDIFLKIGTQTTTWGEFTHLYNQNRDLSLTPVSLQQYATLFTNYKLKAYEAHNLGLDTAAQYRNELNAYLDDLAETYLVDTLAITNFATLERARGADEVRAAHILVNCPPATLPADTLIAYNKALALYNQAVQGADFLTLARQHSDDPSAAQNSGDLGYFTALQMVEPFENQAYNTPVGQTSPIFRTQYGYHFLHVFDRRPAEGQVRVKHIMVLAPRDNSSQEQLAVAKLKIDSLYDALTNGAANFDSLALRFSDDRQSATRGGLIPWFSRSQTLPEFADAAFALTSDGDISKPVQTAAGWHVICRVSRRTQIPQEEFDAMINRAKTQAPTLRRAPRRLRMSQLATQYHFKWNDAGRDTLISIFLCNKAKHHRLDAINAVASLPLASLDGQVFTLADVASHVDEWNLRQTPSENVTDIEYAIIAQYEKSRLPIKYSDYQYAANEYRDGILAFDLMQRQIWNVMPDSAAIIKQYDENPQRYSDCGTFNGQIYYCPTAKVAAKVTKLLSKGKVADAKALATKVVEGPISQGDIYDDVLWPVLPLSPYVVVNGTTTNGSPLPISKCRARVISDLQTIAEQKLVDSLNAKYQPLQLIKVK